MNKFIPLISLLFIAQFSKAQVATGFDGYTGAGTEPAGWTIANGGTTAANSTYTTTGNFGTSAPSVRLDATGEAITSPSFTSSTSLQFWGAGQSIGGASALLVEELVSGSWTTIVNLTVAAGTLLNTNANYGPYTLNTAATKIRITFTKGSGNMAIDDVLINGGILPIYLTSFTGAYTNKKPLLNWSVADEMDINYFTIEKSTDGVNFVDVEKIFSTGILNYSYIDYNSISSTNFYRLKITGATTKYSSIVKISSVVDFNNLQLYPVPAINTLHASFIVDKAQIASVNIFTNQGKIVLQQQQPLNAGYNNINYNIENLPKGTYIIKIIGNTNVFSSVFTK